MGYTHSQRILTLNSQLSTPFNRAPISLKNPTSCDAHPLLAQASALVFSPRGLCQRKHPAEWLLGSTPCAHIPHTGYLADARPNVKRLR
jgi:hypothetical protein